MPAFLFWASCSYAISINYISAPYSPISVSKLKSQMAEQIQNLPVADAFLFSDQAKLSHLDWWQWWLYFDYSDTQVDANVVWDEFEIMRAVGSWSIGRGRRGRCCHTWEWRQMVSFQGNMKIYRANHLWGFSSKFVLGLPDFFLLESRVFSFASVA